MVPAPRVKHGQSLGLSIELLAFGYEEKELPLKPMILNQKTISFGSDPRLSLR